GPSAYPSATHDNAFEVGRNIDTFEMSGDMTKLSEKVGRSFDDGLFGGGAGCTALHTAILLGGDPIYVLGDDYYEENGVHFDEYDEARNEQHVYRISCDGVARSMAGRSRNCWLRATASRRLAYGSRKFRASPSTTTSTFVRDCSARRPCASWSHTPRPCRSSCNCSAQTYTSTRRR